MRCCGADRSSDAPHFNRDKYSRRLTSPSQAKLPAPVALTPMNEVVASALKIVRKRLEVIINHSHETRLLWGYADSLRIECYYLLNIPES